ncbi:MAG: glutaredoxin [Deltaproteobacteria bacterium]|nr:glutaredoxin [Deltaproteobacteria bacterium]MBW2529965.1 glutaredoxin [Deltaproteobacteria bacterium]
MHFPASVVVYVKTGCFFCTAALELLEDKGVSFEKIVVDGRSDLRRWLAAAATRHTVPQTFINGEPVGGFDDLSRLDREGRLDDLLAQQPSVDNPPLRS